MHTNRHPDPWNALLAWAELLVLLILYSALSSAFWAGVTIALSWAWKLSYGVPAVILLGTWVLIGIPAVYVQVMMIADAVGHILIDYVGTVPRLIDPPRRWPVSTPLKVLVWTMSLTSPLGGTSVLCLYSVAQVPRPLDLIGLKARAELNATGEAFARLRMSASR